MQVDEILSEGLKREFRIVVGADDIRKRVDSKLAEVGGKVKVPGFRPGKVPMPILKQRFGPSVMGEVLEETVSETANQAMTDKGFRPAMQPKIEIEKFEDGADLEYKVSLEILPEFEPADPKTFEVERLKVPVEDSVVEEALGRVAASRKQSDPAPEGHAAAVGDIVVVDFVGKRDGEPFDGGAADDYHLELGSNTFIPGFEEQLVGETAGSEKQVAVTFPENYGATHLAGQDVVFDVKVKEVRTTKPAPIDDELAKSAGMQSVDELREAIRKQIESEYGSAVRERLKRQLLDQIAEAHDFDVPESMVDAEFEAIWRQIEHAKEHDQLAEDDKAKSEDELRTEYRGIAERRVRLGLVLSEVGTKNNIQVTQEEINRAMLREAQRYPGQEREVLEYFRNNEGAVSSIRAPLFEEKVVDYLLELVSVKERPGTVADLMSDPDEKAPAKGASPKGKGKGAGKGKAAAKDDAKDDEGG